MTSVCSVGLDMIAIPGDTPAATISGIIADEMAIGMINSKTTACLLYTSERDPALPAQGEGEIPPVAFVNIMQGCDNFCTYCIVPFTRGRQKSRDAGAILDECRALIDNGAKEITLLGQNVNSYGLDKHASGDTSFARLLRKVSELPGLARLRFVTPHPKDLSPEVIAMFGEVPNLCPRLHLPLQAGSDRVLARMNRKRCV